MPDGKSLKYASVMVGLNIKTEFSRERAMHPDMYKYKRWVTSLTESIKDWYKYQPS